MQVLVLGHNEVERLLPMGECVGVMERMFETLASGQAVFPLRQVVKLSDGNGLFVAMPGYLGNPKAAGGKFITAFNDNLGTRFESHQGAVLLFDTSHGQLLAIIDATTITNVRTAAASGAATRVLARRHAHDLAILGSGTQASTHLAAMRAVRPIDRVRVWSRNLGHAKQFAEREGRGGLQVETKDTAEEAVKGADLICTTTAAKEPILLGKWLSPGVHINAIGASTPGLRELDGDAMTTGRLFTDRRESLLNESDDFRVPVREGRMTEGHLMGEVGEVLLGKVQGRTSDEEITIFKSLGIAVEDLASAHYVYTRAKETGVGTWVEFSGERGLGAS